MKIRKMRFGERVSFYSLKVIGLILSIVPFILAVICIVLDFLLSFLHNMASWMIIVFMHPSKKYFYKHELGQDVYIDKNGKGRKKW